MTASSGGPHAPDTLSNEAVLSPRPIFKSAPRAQRVGSVCANAKKSWCTLAAQRSTIWPHVVEWRNGDNYIRLRAKRATLSARGEAFWPSANPSRRDAPGGPHVGEMSGASAPTGNRVTFVDGEDECHVSLTLATPFVLAKDNQRCGGVNVSFDGVYLRRPSLVARRK